MKQVIKNKKIKYFFDLKWVNLKKKNNKNKNNMEFTSFVRAVKKFKNNDIKEIIITPLIIFFEKFIVLDFVFFESKHPK